MSSIAFESGEGRVQVGGRERARMGVLIDDLAWVMHTRTGHEQQQDRNAKVMWTVGNGGEFGERLGWVCLIGNDQMKLLAHIHGQCEINGWVHPDDSEWFADLLERAVADGLLGPDDRGGNYGSWQEVADLARRSTTPLVSSYSVTESWPDPYLISQHRSDLWAHDEDNDDAWYDLSDEERRRIGDEALADCCPRWHPAEWGTHWAERVRALSLWE